MYHAILSLLLTLQVPVARVPAQELQRLATVAQAVTTEAAASRGKVPPVKLAALTLAIWWHESRLSERVHIGERTRWGSDHGKARCMGQLHKTGLLAPGEWETLAGSDLASTQACARATMRVVQRFAGWCRYDGSDESVARVFSAYGTGQGCEATAQGRARAKTARKFAERLRP